MDSLPTLKGNSHYGRRLIDMQDIFSESLNDSEQNQHQCIFILFLKIFWVGPLAQKIPFEVTFGHNWSFQGHFDSSELTLVSFKLIKGLNHRN